MEFPHGRNSREREDEQESALKNRIPLMLPAGSTSLSSSSAFRWSTDGSGSSMSGTGASSSDGVYIEKEHMFDKVVTPSDVGKLNRLVIPKQHAEKYFPLDPTSGDKGLLLCFEDRTGKPWRFRYSYWNSSQSYVMTKGWSRFVKEKLLDAGDTVSFGRGAGEQARERLFIDWKRRSEVTHDLSRIPGQLPLTSIPFPRTIGSWGHNSFYLPQSPPATLYEHHQSRQAIGQQFVWFRSGVSRPPQITAPGLPVVLESVPVGSGQATAKRVRLFGVNLDSPESEGNSNDTNLGSITMPNWRSRPISAALPLPLFELSSNGMNEQSTAAVVYSPSSSKIKEGHSSLDLDL